MVQPEKKKPESLIAPRPNETDEERRFREAMERLGGQIMSTVDAAIGLRTASPGVQRSRHIVRGELGGALLRAMNTLYMHAADESRT